MMRNRLIESRLTPNAISITGLVLNVAAAVLITQRLFFLAGLTFIVGSVMDMLDGRYSRMSGKGTPFGAFLDSTLDRIEEGIVLTAVAAYFAEQGDELAVAGGGARRARLADGQLHARAGGGARRRVQGRPGDEAGAGRDPVRRPPVREGRGHRRLRAAGSGDLPDGRRSRPSPSPSGSGTCAASSNPCLRAPPEPVAKRADSSEPSQVDLDPHVTKGPPVGTLEPDVARGPTFRLLQVC